MRAIRTFVAVDVWQELRDRARLVIKSLSSAPAKVRWTPPEQMHLTLNFLGDVQLTEVPAVCASVAGAAAPFAPFDVELTGVGVFPSLSNPRTIWLGVAEGGKRLVELHEAIENGLAEAGFRADNRRFRPHLTIGRVRSLPEGPGELAALVAGLEEFEAGPMMVSQVAVYSSELGRDGPRYEVLGHGDLLGR